MMSDGSVRPAVHLFARRKKTFKETNSSPGIPPPVGHWNGGIQNAAAPRPKAATPKVFNRQWSSASAVFQSPSDCSLSVAAHPRPRRKEQFKQKTSSPGIPPKVGHWNGEIKHATAPRNNFKKQKSSAASVSPSSSDGSVSTAVNQRVRRKKKFKQKNSCAGIPPQEEDWDLEISVIADDLRGVSVMASQDTKPPLTDGYMPAVHHAQPLRWVCENFPIEPDQFADTDEKSQVEDGARKIQEAANKPTLAAPDGLKGVIAVNRPLRAGYVPADHHAQPLRWARNSLPAEPGQFADADE